MLAVNEVDGCSYALNYQLFGGTGYTLASWLPKHWSRRNVQTIADGSSNTIGFAERAMNVSNYGTQADGTEKGAIVCFSSNINGTAEAWSNAPIFNGRKVGQKFQTNARPDNADPDLAHAFTASGILVGMMDGSVRSVSNSVTNTTWTRAANPEDGNPLESDW